ncbi:hypothetical protein ES703_66616 [subsurface metagenome]
MLHGSLLAFELPSEGHKISGRKRNVSVDTCPGFFDETPDVPFDHIAEYDLAPHQIFAKNCLGSFASTYISQLGEGNPFSVGRIHEKVFYGFFVIPVFFGKTDQNRCDSVRLIDVGRFYPVQSGFDNFRHVTHRNPVTGELFSVQFNNQLGDAGCLFYL